MSQPTNPLSRYRTYSYHQFLIACSDSDIAESIGTDITRIQHKSNEYRYANRGGYVVLIDGMTDAHLRITKASWVTVITGEDDSADGAFTSLGPTVEGILNVYEPSGATFLAVIAESAKTLGVNPIIMPLALKTIFVGHKNDGTVEYINYVKPFIFNIKDISAVYDSTGAKYRINVHGLVGSGTTLNQQVLSGSSIAIEKDETLRVALDKLELIAAKIADNGVADYEDAQVRSGGSTIAVSKPKFKIHLTDGGYSPNTIVGDNSHIRTANKVGGSIINLSQNVQSKIASSIEKVLISSSDIVKQYRADNPGEDLELRNIFSITLSTQIKDGGVVYNYHIGKRKVPFTPVGKNTNDSDADLEFDYLFTGKNIDIINWDLRLIHGLQVINTIGTIPSLTSGIGDRTGTKSEIVIVRAGTQLDNPTGIPSQINIGGKVTNPNYSNTNYPIATAEFFSVLSEQAKVDSILSLLTIHGNPILLGNMTVGPSDLLNNNLTKGAINGDWIDNPTIIKINVRFPLSPDDPTAGFQDFWYQGVYVMLKVRQIFDNGKFTQEIKIHTITGSHPTFDNGEVSGGTAAARTSSAGAVEPIGVRTVTAIRDDLPLGQQEATDIILGIDPDFPVNELDPFTLQVVAFEMIQSQYIEENPSCDKLNDPFNCFGSDDIFRKNLALEVIALAETALVRADDYANIPERLEELEGFDIDIFNAANNEGIAQSNVTDDTDSDLAISDADDTPVDLIQSSQQNT